MIREATRSVSIPVYPSSFRAHTFPERRRPVIMAATPEEKKAFQAFYESGRVEAYLQYARLREKEHGGSDPQGQGDPDGGLPRQR